MGERNLFDHFSIYYAQMGDPKHSQENDFDVRVLFDLLVDESEAVFVLKDALFIEGVVCGEGFVNHSNVFET